MITRRFDIDFAPLGVSAGINVEGGVAAKQRFSGDTGLWTPDFAIAALVLQPWVQAYDSDLNRDTLDNSRLGEIKWYEVQDGAETLIVSSDSGDYTVTMSGAQAGRLVCRKNVEVGKCRTLRFTAVYKDPRYDIASAPAYAIDKTVLVRCVNATLFPRLELDAPSQVFYDPVREPKPASGSWPAKNAGESDDAYAARCASVPVESRHKVTATLRVSGAPVPASSRIFIWELPDPSRATQLWHKVGQDPLDYFAEVSADGASVTIDRERMGEGTILRCTAVYDPDGSPQESDRDDSCPTKAVAFIRRVAETSYDMQGVPTRISPAATSISPKAVVADSKGIVEGRDAMRVFSATWYSAKNNQNCNLTYAQCGSGFSPTLGVDKVDDTWGAVYGLDVVDMGPLKAWADSDGKILTDSDGKILLIK